MSNHRKQRKSSDSNKSSDRASQSPQSEDPQMHHQNPSGLERKWRRIVLQKTNPNQKMTDLKARFIEAHMDKIWQVIDRNKGKTKHEVWFILVQAYPESDFRDFNVNKWDQTYTFCKPTTLCKKRKYMDLGLEIDADFKMTETAKKFLQENTAKKSKLDKKIKTKDGEEEDEDGEMEEETASDDLNMHFKKPAPKSQEELKSLAYEAEEKARKEITKFLHDELWKIEDLRDYFYYSGSSKEVHDRLINDPNEKLLQHWKQLESRGQMKVADRLYLNTQDYHKKQVNRLKASFEDKLSQIRKSDEEEDEDFEKDPSKQMKPSPDNKPHQEGKDRMEEDEGKKKKHGLAENLGPVLPVFPGNHEGTLEEKKEKGKMNQNNPSKDNDLGERKEPKAPEKIKSIQNDKKNADKMKEENENEKDDDDEEVDDKEALKNFDKMFSFLEKNPFLLPNKPDKSVVNNNKKQLDIIKEWYQQETKLETAKSLDKHSQQINVINLTDFIKNFGFDATLRFCSSEKVFSKSSNKKPPPCELLREIIGECKEYFLAIEKASKEKIKPKQPTTKEE